VTLAWLAVLGTAWGAHAQSPAAPPATKSAATVEGAPTAAAVVPPFWVAGVVITESRRSAVLVVLDETRRDVGVVTLREAETYGGYRLATIEADRVLFERDGTVFPVVVGRPYAGPRGTSDAAPRAFFVPGPDKPTPAVPSARRPFKGGAESGAAAAGPPDPASANAPDPEALGKFLERLFSHPLMQQKMQELRPAIQQSLERARGAGQTPPGP
jgi:hypothetical protein